MYTAKSVAALQSLAQRFIRDVEVSTKLNPTVEITERKDSYLAVLRLGKAGTGVLVSQRLLDEDRGEEILAKLADDWSEPIMNGGGT
jgi:hypothetical protein